MKFLFENESFAFEALRTAGYACYGGADLGEALATARGIPDGDEAAWHQRWKALAERLHAVGVSALAAGRRVSVRDALLRACGYYRAADFYLRDDPAHDPEVALLSQRVRESFHGRRSSVVTRTGLIVGVITVMVAKPGLMAALCVLLAGYLAGAAVARLTRLSPQAMTGPLR
jgi:hypothetical protein